MMGVPSQRICVQTSAPLSSDSTKNGRRGIGTSDYSAVSRAVGQSLALLFRAGDNQEVTEPVCEGSPRLLA
jgi:hypothetical protein